MAIDLNSRTMLSDRINRLIDNAVIAERKKEPPREYLGASVVGHPCDRNVQYQWLAIKKEIQGEEFSAKMLKIFDRGHIYEDRARRWLQAAGFLFTAVQTEISDFDNRFGGHIDGIIAGFYPGDLPFPLPALWECKCLNNKGWRSIEKDGLKKHSPTYWSQMHTYMGYLGLPRCLFTVVNADNMELQHLLHDFDSGEAVMVKSKVGRVFTATALGELLPRISTDPAYYLCSMCNFRDICWSSGKST